MLKKSKSFPYIGDISNIVKSSKSFYDFNLLRLKGDQTFLSYGTFLMQNPNSTKHKRRKMITYHYKKLF